MYQIQISRLRLLALACLPVSGIAIASTAYAACVDPNTCFGTGALQQHVGGGDNSAFGFQALGADLSGYNNTAVGSLALTNNVTGFGNTALGVAALQYDTEAELNTAIGAYALQGSTGSANVAIGYNALNGMARNSENEFVPVHNGLYNVAIGLNAMSFAGSGNGNTALGSWALSGYNLPDANPSPSTGEFNTAIGHTALQAISTGANNTATGARAMLGGSFEYTSGITGSNNTADGYKALYWIKTGNGNTAMGADALFLMTTGSNNTASGFQAMQGSGDDPIRGGFGLSGNSNVAYGARALRLITTGSSNTAIGANSLLSNTYGNYNTANGNNALRNATTGIRNVALGHRAGEAVTTGSDNIIIGGDNRGRVTDTGVIRIGRSANQKKTFVAGIRGIKTGLTGAVAVLIDANGQLGTVNSSREIKEEILPMGDVSDRLLSLRPITFRYKEADIDGRKPIQYGLIAEEVAETFPELVVYDANGKPETVSYHLLATLLLNEFQKEREVTQAQAGRIAELEQEFARLAEVVDRLNHASMVASAQ